MYTRVLPGENQSTPNNARIGLVLTMFKSILVPLDGSAGSNSALPAARTFARATGAAITLIRVCDHDEVNDAQTNLTRVADELAASGVQVRAVVRHGDPGKKS
jgi:nucleotide-binding universal stress UspA family protein